MYVYYVCAYIHMYVQTFMYAHMCACHCVYVHSYRSVSIIVELANS